MNKVREYISLMQSLNIDNGYDEEFLWETIYDGLKLKLKEMWTTIVSPPEDLQEKYPMLVKLEAVVEDNEAEQKKNASSSSVEAGDDKEKKKKRRRKEKKKKTTDESESGEGKTKEPRVPKEFWEKRCKEGLCLKCGSDEHLLRECKSNPVLTNTKDVAKTSSKPKSKGKDAEKVGAVAAVAAVDQCEPEKSKEPVAANTSVDRKSTRLNSSHTVISYAVFC